MFNKSFSLRAFIILSLMFILLISSASAQNTTEINSELDKNINIEGNWELDLSASALDEVRALCTDFELVNDSINPMTDSVYNLVLNEASEKVLSQIGLSEIGDVRIHSKGSSLIRIESRNKKSTVVSGDYLHYSSNSKHYLWLFWEHVGNLFPRKDKMIFEIPAIDLSQSVMNLKAMTFDSGELIFRKIRPEKKENQLFNFAGDWEIDLMNSQILRDDMMLGKMKLALDGKSKMADLMFQIFKDNSSEKQLFDVGLHDIEKVEILSKGDAFVQYYLASKTSVLNVKANFVIYACGGISFLFLNLPNISAKSEPDTWVYKLLKSDDGFRTLVLEDLLNGSGIFKYKIAQ